MHLVARSAGFPGAAGDEVVAAFLAVSRLPPRWSATPERCDSSLANWNALRSTAL
jgi:hypothetical protein